jgi:hypothetical protein
MILDSGQIWTWEQPFGWQFRSILPFPVVDLRFYTGGYAMDSADRLWFYSYDEWHFAGVPPTSAGIGDAPHPRPSTWGQVKTEAGR